MIIWTTVRTGTFLVGTGVSSEIMAAPLGHIDLNVGAFVVWRGGWRMRYMPEAPVSVWVVIVFGGATVED